LAKNNKNENVAVKCKLMLEDYSLMQKSHLVKVYIQLYPNYKVILSFLKRESERTVNVIMLTIQTVPHRRYYRFWSQKDHYNALERIEENVYVHASQTS